MKKVIIAALCVFSLYGCTGKGSEAHTRAGGKTEAEKIETRRKALNIDMTEQRRLQEAVDNGGQVWRKEAPDVAHAALIAESVNVKLTDCKVAEESPESCIVKAALKDNTFTVQLKRLVKPGGIWTATEIAVDGPELTIGGASVHDHGNMEHAGHEHSDANHDGHDHGGHSHN